MTAERPVVFVVDDDVRVREALSSLLASAGFGVMVFASATDFLRAEKPDTATCLVLDLELPDINGLVLAQKLRALFGPATPIIVVSGDTSIETLRELSHAGATYFFPKPLNPAALVTRLREILTR